jgi:dolichyl-diphosphooligosaccharide--protein glycosyltransferase
VLLVIAMLVVTWVRLLPLGFDAAEHGAETAVRSQIGRDLAADGGATADEIARWIGEHQDRFDGMLRDERERRRDFYSFETSAGKRLPYLGGLDSYLWLRSARNVLRHGSPCDSVVEGECRDDFTLAPVGTRGRYATSFHVTALVAVHRAASLLNPDTPLSLSAFLLSVLVGALGVIPAFLLGTRFGGAVGGFLCAILSGLNTMVLYRSFGADNDIWNVVLPLFEVWAAVEAIYTDSPRRRAAYIALAAAVTGLHAAIWGGWIFTCGIVVLGLGANAILWAMRRGVHGVAADPHGRTRHALLLLGGYLIAATVATWWAGAVESPVSSALSLIRSVVAAIRVTDPAPTTSDLVWPSVFATVGELRAPNLPGIASSMTGAVYFFVAWLGLILLMLPRDGWNSWHFGILVGGNFLYRYLLTFDAIEPWTLTGLLLLPLAIGLGAYLADRDSPVEDQGAGAMIILWFLGGLVLSHQGNRFLIILAPPLAILCAATVGRVYDWIARQPWAASPYVRAAVLLALLPTAYPPVAQGARTARAYLPMMNDTWYGALEKLRDDTPPDAVVNTWWDYGYFTKHVADRRVLADGGTLRTRVPYWFARALMADTETQSVGLLRMLNCGSDATPEPEERRGAFSALRDGGLDAAAAHAAILALASMDRAGGHRHLRSIGLDDDQAETVLERTHCTPAPAYLVLPETLVRSMGWRLLGGWNFTAAAAAPASYRPTPPTYLTPKWIACVGDVELRCDVGARLRSGAVLRAVVVSRAAPHAARFTVAPAPDREETIAPASVLVVAADGIAASPTGGPVHESVLVDLDANRVLIGSAEVLRSTFTSLMFLDGRHTRHFADFDRREGLSGRLRTWEILW